MLRSIGFYPMLQFALRSRKASACVRQRRGNPVRYLAGLYAPPVVR